MKTTSRLCTRWAPLLALTAILAACGAAVAPKPTVTPDPATAPEPTAEATCDDSAIRLLDRAAGVHGAIVADTLHLGGAIAPATCTDPTNESLQAGLSMPDGRTAQAQQSEYYLLVIRYTDGNRLYVISHRGDGTACVVNTNDECVAEVTDLPDDFDLDGLPDDVERTLPAGRPAAPTVSPSPGGDDAPPAPSPPPEPSPPSGGDDTPPGASPPPAATGPLGAASNPQPRDGATGVTVNAPLLSWAAAPGAAHYYVHWDIRTPSHAGVKTTSTFLRMSARDSDLVDYGVTGRLDGETTYYWYVEAVTAGTVGCPSTPACNRSRMWSFTTGPAPPEEAPPEEETPPAGETAPAEEPTADVIISFPKAHYSFAEEGENLTEEVPCPPRKAHYGPVCKWAYTTYTIPMEWSGPTDQQAIIVYWTSVGTARSQDDADSDPHTESNRKDFYRWRRTSDNIRGPWNFRAIQIIQDDKEEEDETFYVHIEPRSITLRGGGIDHSKVIACRICRATITIVDND